MTYAPMDRGSGPPSFCWVCSRQLQRAPGKGLGLFYFRAVLDQIGIAHRVHNDCLAEAISDGCRQQEQKK